MFKNILLFIQQKISINIFFSVLGLGLRRILKLRNADVEARIGIAGSKKKSTRADWFFELISQGKMAPL